MHLRLTLLLIEMAQQKEFLSACPNPLVIQPYERIAWLEEQLKDPENQRQRTNILALIQMYKNGELEPLTTSYTIWVCDGRIIDDPRSSGNFPPGESAIMG